MMQDNLSRISSLFSVPKLNCADAAEKFANDFSQLKNENKQLKIAHFTRLGEQVVCSDKSQLYRLENADYDEMRAFINSAKAKVGGMLVVVSAAEDTLKYVIFSEEMNMASEIKKINAALCGKGGGSAVMVQGKFGVNAEDCAAYFKSEYSAQINHCT